MFLTNIITLSGVILLEDIESFIEMMVSSVFLPSDLQNIRN